MYGRGFSAVVCFLSFVGPLRPLLDHVKWGNPMVVLPVSALRRNNCRLSPSSLLLSLLVGCEWDVGKEGGGA